LSRFITDLKVANIQNTQLIISDILNSVKQMDYQFRDLTVQAVGFKFIE